MQPRDIEQLIKLAERHRAARQANPPVTGVVTHHQLSWHTDSMDKVAPECEDRGGVIRLLPCAVCGKRHLQVQVLNCARHGTCTNSPGQMVNGVMACQRCNDLPRPVHAEVTSPTSLPVVPPPAREPVRWAYGVVTVRERSHSGGLLERTLASLSDGGFPNPRLFIDDPYERYGRAESEYPHTNRSPRIRAWGNTVLALWELVLRDPEADRYALFQDDMVTGRNLRQYLEAVKWPHRGYLNLYTFPSNAELAPAGYTGFYKSNQLGKGAVALVFDRDGIDTLLSSPHLLKKSRSQSSKRWKSVDGGIVQAMRDARWFEYVHSPSLVQHTGTGGQTTLKNVDHPQARDFPGEAFDLLTLASVRKESSDAAP